MKGQGRQRVQFPRRIDTILSLMRQELVDLASQRGALTEHMRQLQEKINAYDIEIARLEAAYKKDKETAKGEV